MNFNEMLKNCWEEAKRYEIGSYLYVAESPASLKYQQCVFYGRNNTSIIVVCDSEGKTVLKEVDMPYMDCLPIRHPAKISQEESLQYLYDAGHRDDWKSVTFRKPLGPEPYNPLYIYTYEKESGVVSYRAVDSTNGNVMELF